MYPSECKYNYPTGNHLNATRWIHILKLIQFKFLFSLSKLSNCIRAHLRNLLHTFVLVLICVLWPWLGYFPNKTFNYGCSEAEVPMANTQSHTFSLMPCSNMFSIWKISLKYILGFFVLLFDYWMTYNLYYLRWVIFRLIGLFSD